MSAFDAGIFLLLIKLVTSSENKNQKVALRGDYTNNARKGKIDI